MSATETLWAGTARTLDEASDALKREEEAAVRASAAEALVRTALLLVSITEGIVANIWDALFSEKVCDVRAEGERLGLMTERAIAVTSGTRDLALTSQEQGYTITGLTELSEGIKRLERAREDLARRWPRLDPEKMDQAAARMARGEFADLSDVYHEFPELQNPARP